LAINALAGNVVCVEILVRLGFALLEAELQVAQYFIEGILVHGEAGLRSFEQGRWSNPLALAFHSSVKYQQRR